MDKRDLAAFLRGKRERLRPADVGLPAGARRRTPGLRREEVAQLALISVDHYSRLEQARGRHPSRAVLQNIARALRLSTQERAHLFRLAGHAAPDAAARPSDAVAEGTRRLLDRIGDAGVIVFNGGCEVLAWNPLAAAMFEDFAALGAHDRNIVRRYFLDPAGGRYGIAAARRFAGTAVSYLRLAATRYPNDPGITALIRDLRAGSAEFAALWESQELHVERHSEEIVDHPTVGRLTLDFEILSLPEQDQQVVMFTAEPDSPTHRALELLRVIGALQSADAARASALSSTADSSAGSPSPVS
ncbi:transcriptional regulator [Virgisporangium aliadipatigenens]|uniref:Transcriptional regulator n=1 Tax=Virgisporangium aliadipatigenens TaxID=741659 RepID=A0A8J4DN24_9ACTN|nr:helix-turn-helix transcriptional regulator [Virgisporangium aliadipatigenens]GIJ43123.1 transcriptional regulator [Virgisporangium aliadipatigenens]